MQTAGLEALSPKDRARVIYTQARSAMNDRLWQAAIGGAQDENPAAQAPCRHTGVTLPMDMLTLLGTGQHETGALPPMAAPIPVIAPTLQPESVVAVDWPAPKATAGGLLAGLGANSRYAGTLQAAAERSGLPAPALAAIVDAEAAKRADGGWNPLSRNPRSSAAGLGQFLSGTWIGMAEKPGTWLNDAARQNGWLKESGRVDPAARGSLLALRYDPKASINSIADYAKANIATIRRAGIRTGDDPQALARTAYLGHHLGPGDAIRYLKGGLSENRAAHLLKAQIGSGRAVESINRTGDAAVAHRNWLNGYISRKIRPDRFTGSLGANST